MSRLSTHVALCCAGWFVFAPAPGSASILELFGAGPRSAAMAGAMPAAAYGAEATFDNPALLSEASYGGAIVGLAWTSFDVDIQMMRPVCVDTYQACQAAHSGQFAHRMAKNPPPNTSLQIGWHAPLAGPFDKRVVIGAQMTLPLGRLFSISGPDPQTPHFYMYEGLPDRFALLLATSFEPTSWVALGVGMQVLASLSSDVDMTIDVTNHVMDRASVEVRLQPISRLVAGVVIRPYAGVQLGVCYRQQVNFSYAVPSNIGIGTTAHAALLVEQKTLFTPDSLHLGAAWRSSSGRLLVSLSTTFAMWSAAPDPSPRVDIDLSGGSLDALGVGEVLDVGEDAAPIALNFSNTWSPRLGVEWLALPRWMVRGGYGFVVSPAGYATGAYNYLDNDAHVLAIGSDIAFEPPIESRPPSAGAASEPPRFDHRSFVRVALQARVLPRRSVRKIDRNDPVGDFEHDGVVLHANLSLGGTW